MVERDRHRVGDLDPLAREVAAAAVPRGGGVAVERGSTPAPSGSRAARSSRRVTPPASAPGMPSATVDGRVLRRAVEVGGARQRERRAPSAGRSAATCRCRPGVVMRMRERVGRRSGAERPEQVLRQARAPRARASVRAPRRVVADPDLLEPDAGLAAAAGLGRDRADLVGVGGEDLDLELREPLPREVDAVSRPRRSIVYTRCGPSSRRTPTFVIQRPRAPCARLLRGRTWSVVTGCSSSATRRSLPTLGSPDATSHADRASPSNAFAGRADGVNPNAGVPYVVARTDLQPAQLARRCGRGR